MNCSGGRRRLIILITKDRYLDIHRSATVVCSACAQTHIYQVTVCGREKGNANRRMENRRYSVYDRDVNRTGGTLSIRRAVGASVIAYLIAETGEPVVIL